MNINKKTFTIALLGLLALGSSGCRKYLDVNTNPNVAQDAGPEFLLPSAQISLGSAMGVNLQINGSIWGQYWTQSPGASQYKSLEQYSPTASSYDGPWTLLYSAELEDLDIMEKKAAASNQTMYVGISKLLKAYSFQVITDGWGNVPFSEALKGQAEDGGIISPKFDQQDAIYDGLIALAQQGIIIMDSSSANGLTVKGDLIYGGDPDAWLAFGNTLLLKIYLRQSQHNPAKAQAGIQALYATGPTFIGLGGDAQINYISTSGNQNPLYAEEVGLGSTQNLVASATVLDSMLNGGRIAGFPNTFSDPRADVFFDNAQLGGLTQGLYNAPSSTQVAIPSAVVGANATDPNSATAPVKFITSYESAFLQAEAVARGWATGNAQALFEEGIQSNFTVYGLSNAQDYIDSNAYGQYPTNGTVTQQIRAIIIQKWFSMTGNQGFEAWTEWRRTGYPDWFHVSENSIIGKTPASFPRAFFYPDVTVQRNQNFPGQRLITDKVSWDVR